MSNKIETFRTREDGFLLVLIQFIEKEQFLVFLLDPWKTGFHDFDIHRGSMKQLKQKLGIPSIKFHNISKKETANLLRQNYEIANELQVEIPSEAYQWMEKLGVFKIEYDQSLYSCFNCESGNLSDEQVNEILDIARNDLKDNNIATSEEEQYFKICKNCEDDLHKKHEGQAHHHH